MHSHSRFDLIIRPAAFIAVWAGLLAGAAHAVTPPNTVDLSSTPPDLSASVDPNFVVTFDDSGSMSNQYIPDANSATNVKRFYSSTWNLIYYNPNILYQPAMLPNGTNMPNSTYSAAWKDGICSNRPTSMNYYGGDHPQCSENSSAPGTINLGTGFGNTYGGSSNTKTVSGQGTDNGFYAYFAPLGNPNAPQPGAPGGTGAPASTPAGCLGITDVNNDKCYIVVPISAAQQANFANWYSYYRFRNIMARTGLSRALGKFGSSIRVAWQTISTSAQGDGQAVLLSPGGSDTAVGSSGTAPGVKATIDSFTGDANNACTTLGTTRCNFFNWLYNVRATTNTPNRAAMLRVGKYFEYGSGITTTKNPYYDTASAKELSCRQNFSMLVTDGYWNEPNPANTSPVIPLDSLPQSFPDGTAYVPTDQEAQIYGNEGARTNKGCSNSSASSGSNTCVPSLSDIAFYYWRTDLRGDLTDNVPPYFADTTTGITGSVPYDNTQPPSANKELYFNPANDPATWQHLVMYIIGLGVPGVSGIQIPTGSTIDWDQTGSDAVALRTGTKQWPQIINNDPSGLDDTWHATINSRGEYFNAGNPSDLASALDGVLSTITQRTASSTAVAVSTAFLINGTFAYAGGYSSVDWSGYMRHEAINTATGDLATPAQISWDAACLLTGGTCNSTNSNVGAAPDPMSGVGGYGNARHIFTKTIPASPGPSTIAGGGIKFQWSSLSTSEQSYLNLDPATGLTDANGQLRLQYLRGVRTHEGGTPKFHNRSSVLGAIVNSQTVAVSFPRGEFHDGDYPVGSPERTAFDAGNGYEVFAKAHINRRPMVYVGANDGMLHAFDGNTGVENWSYVPATVFPQLSAYTRDNPFVYTSYVDNTPLVTDVFFGGSWHTVLISTLRFGGRGVFAIDVTDPDSFGTDEGGSAMTGKLLWEFSNVTDPAETSNLGYTFGQPNVDRIRYNGGTWVVMVSGGYFCANISTGSNPPNVPESAGSKCPDGTAPAGASTNRSSLFVLDVATGKLIQEIQTPAGIPSYGLAASGIGHENRETTDPNADFAVAGDMLGQLWRFDVADPTPSNWQAKVDRMYVPATAGAQPITVKPVMFPTGAPGTGLTVVFATGRYLGLSDRTNSIPQQAVYGIREFGPSGSAYAAEAQGLQALYRSPTYPESLSDLTQQTLSTGAPPTGLRMLSGSTPPRTGSGSGGWYYKLPATGERVVVSPSADFQRGITFMTTLIPGGSDPCNPSRTGAFMAFQGSNGLAFGVSNGNGSDVPSLFQGGSFGNGVVGFLATNVPISGSLPFLSSVGGGTVTIPGIGIAGLGGPPKLNDSYWRRRSWRELF